MKHTYQGSELLQEKLDSYSIVTLPQIILISMEYNKCIIF